MKKPQERLATSGGIIFDLVVTGVFFLYMTSVCMGHVPASTYFMKLVFGAFGAVPVTGLFWLALGFLRVTWVDQVRRNKEKQER